MHRKVKFRNQTGMRRQRSEVRADKQETVGFLGKNGGGGWG